MLASVARFEAHYPSPLAGVPDEAWERLVYAMSIQPINAVSDSGGLGCFAMRPRRLAELGVMGMDSIRGERTKKGRQIEVGEFVLPYTRDRFLGNPTTQSEIFTLSMTKYDADIQDGTIKIPEGIGHAETLVVLHVGGRGALKRWPDGIFPNTAKLIERCGRIF